MFWRVAVFSIFSSYFKIILLLNRQYLFNKKKRWMCNENIPSFCIIWIHVEFLSWEWVPDMNYFRTEWRLGSISSLRHCCFLIFMDLTFLNKKRKYFDDLKNLISCSFNLAIAWGLGYMFLMVAFYFMFCIQVDLAHGMFKCFRREAWCISHHASWCLHKRKQDFLY